MKHVVMFSGGVGSWAAAKRVVAKHGTEDVVLLFADTLMEDEDLYRFIDEAAKNVGVPITRLCEGRTPWQVFRDVRFLGNSRIDPCSRILKRELLDKWRNANCDPSDTVIYLGIDWSEQHRLARLLPRVAPWKYEAPMCESPYLTKNGMLSWLNAEGIATPRLYDMNMPHNNCGGFCVKAGQAQFLNLLKVMPERYAFHEAQEEAIREELGDVSILTDRRGGDKTPLTLKELRERFERCDIQPSLFGEDWGGCGCAIDVGGEDDGADE